MPNEEDIKAYNKYTPEQIRDFLERNYIGIATKDVKSGDTFYGYK